jgi:ATP-dependent Clp protease ATP-binding subunit ClpC
MKYSTPPTYKYISPKIDIVQSIISDHTLTLRRRFQASDVRYRALLPKLRLFEMIGALLFAFASVGYGVYQLSPAMAALDFNLDTTLSMSAPFLLFGCVLFLFFWYRKLASKKNQKYITTTPNGKSQDLWEYMTPGAMAAINRAVLSSADTHIPQIDTIQLFVALLADSRIRTMFVRLSVPVAKLETLLRNMLSASSKQENRSVELTDAVLQSIFHSYTLAIEADVPVIDVTELLFATVLYDEQLQELLYDLEIDTTKIENMLLWLRIQAALRRQNSKQASGAAHVSKHGMDRAMTAVATPFLNSFSHDMTLDVKYGRTEPCIARDVLLEDILRSGASGEPNLLLVGEHGAGKRSIAEGIASRIVSGSVPAAFEDKRMVELSTTALLAGTSVSGAQERLLRIFAELARARNIIVYIENIQDLVSADGAGLDVSEALSKLISSRQSIVIATATPQSYKQLIAHTALSEQMTAITVGIMSQNQTIQVLESKAPYLEYRQDVFFSYQALEAAATYAKQFMQDQVLPASAITLLTEAGAIAAAARGKDVLVTAEDVATILSKKTGIPVQTINDDESTKLLRLEEAMHERVVGQTEAVQLVANALRRARAAIRATNRPIANFLFLGPTGVGKTELAKTIADVYFGGESRMIRLDMSEFQDSRAIERLIGTAGQQGSGILTEAVREQPFSLILLDEMEKADPSILNIFLQVFDDGRLTDSVGRTVDFTNTIIIATSNAGTSYVQEQLRAGTAFDAIRNELLHGKLQEYYRPEFLNRFDGIVLFKSLLFDEIKQIAGLMLKRTQADLEEKGIDLVVSDGALEALAKAGFDPEFGARPMRRAIQDNIENPIASLLLSGKVGRRATLQIDDQLQVRVQ